MAKVAQGVPSGDLVAKLLLILIVASWVLSVRTLEHLTSSAQDIPLIDIIYCLHVFLGIPLVLFVCL